MKLLYVEVASIYTSTSKHVRVCLTCEHNLLRVCNMWTCVHPCTLGGYRGATSLQCLPFALEVRAAPCWPCVTQPVGSLLAPGPHCLPLSLPDSLSEHTHLSQFPRHAELLPLTGSRYTKSQMSRRPFLPCPHAVTTFYLQLSTPSPVLQGTLPSPPWPILCD